jgi:hypothetical protein
MVNEQFDQLEAEYKLIQDKIDGIGEFKFKVRGWLVTILAALLAALATDKVPIPFNFFVIVIPIIFHLLEREQAEIQSVLSERAKIIEKVISSLRFPKDSSPARMASLERALLRELGSSPRVAVLLHNGARRNIKQIARGMLNFNTNKIYHILYGLTVVIIVINALMRSRSEKEDASRKNEISYKTIVIQESKSENMKDKTFEEIEEKMYSLVSQIDYGDISDLDVYWHDLSSSILKLDLKGWNKPRSKELSNILKSLPEGYVDSTLTSRTKRMEDLSEEGSSGSFDKEDLQKLQVEANIFEKEFEDLIKKLKNP